MNCDPNEVRIETAMTKDLSSTNPYYTKPLRPRYNRRATHHDYTLPAKYMITLKKASYIPSLSQIVGSPSGVDNDTPRAIPTPTGNLFERAIEIWLEKHPQLNVPEIVIMPVIQ